MPAPAPAWACMQVLARHLQLQAVCMQAGRGRKAQALQHSDMMRGLAAGSLPKQGMRGSEVSMDGLPRGWWSDGSEAGGRGAAWLHVTMGDIAPQQQQPQMTRHRTDTCMQQDAWLASAHEPDTSLRESHRPSVQGDSMHSWLGSDHAKGKGDPGPSGMHTPSEECSEAEEEVSGLLHGRCGSPGGCRAPGSR